MHADPVSKAKERELDKRKRPEVFASVKMEPQTKGVVDTRCVLTWKEVRSNKNGGASTGREGLLGSRSSGSRGRHRRLC